MSIDTNFCEFEDCTVDGTEMRGAMWFCPAHAREVDEEYQRRRDVVCEFDGCMADGTERRGGLKLCATHAAEYDEMMRLEEEGNLRTIARLLDGARNALKAWFADGAWTVYLDERRPSGVWALRMYRTEDTVAQCRLRADGDPEALARGLLKMVREAHHYTDFRGGDDVEPCEHCDAEESPMTRHDDVRGWVCPVCDEALDLDGGAS